jgi:hypothetical protein
MKKKVKGAFIIVSFLMGFFVGFTQEVAFAQSFVLRTLRFTGTIYPPDAKDLKGGLAYQRILIENKEWILKVTKVEDVNYPGMTQLQLLGPMPPRLNLQEGVKGVLSPFQKPDILGKVITIQGFVYVSSEWMEVNILKIGKGEKK